MRKSSLRLAFTVPVLVQLVVAVGLVGYLSFRNGQQAVQTLASQLRSEVSARIEGELASYFGDPHAINRLNATAFSNGDLDIENATQGEHLLFQQMRIYPTIAFVYCGSARSGEFFGILRSPDTGELQLSYGNASNNFYRNYYSLDVRGNRQHFIYQANEPYDARSRPWFEAALHRETPAWTEVYIAFTTRLPNVTASLPVYDSRDRALLGVCATDVVLPEEFRTFLKELEIGQSGQAFVVDRNGNLISSSTDEPLMKGTEEDPQFLQAVDSNNPLVQESAAYLSTHFGSFDKIHQVQQLTFSLHGKRQFLEVLPFSDGFGLDWLIVVVVPESDYMGQILWNTRITILLCAMALVIALGIGILLARRVTAPILKLNTTVKDIAQGDWNQRVRVTQTDEVGELANSVNSMAAQIQQSFHQLESQRNAFSRFFPPEYLHFLNKHSVTDIELGDHISKDMAVMFSDIRGFTSLAEKMKPQEAFDFINTYLQRISPQIRAHHGFVVKFLGDGVMAIFPETVEDAIDAAIAQFRQVQDYNQQHQRDDNFDAIEIGIGLHVGHVMAGMIGEYDRIQPDAVSDAVNLAARLEGLSKVYGAALVISEAVRLRLADRDRYQLRFLDQVIVKGRTQSIAIYEVLDAEMEPQRVFKQNTLATFEAGIKAYSDRDLAAAKAYFARVVAQNPADITAQLYEQRVSLLIEKGVPQNWDGSWVFKQKR
ncbi:MAG: HAMP domain-containing protein [Leptolyngbya sp. SIO1E4]|nr:HAMP domain-containing protein [Leptolyngbya sp. SIO1E4]